MARKEKLNNLEEFIAYTIRMSKWNKERYNLRHNWAQTFVDEDAGKQFIDTRDSLRHEYYRIQRELREMKFDVVNDRSEEIEQKELELADISRLQDQHEETIPDRQEEHSWWLERKLYSYNNEYIYLSVELGVMLDGIWTKKEAKSWQNEGRVGRLTLEGMLKRLGHSDIQDKVKEAQRNEKETRLLNSIRYLEEEREKLQEKLSENTHKLSQRRDDLYNLRNG